MCRDLEDLISVEDLKHLDKGIEQKYWESHQTPELSVINVFACLVLTL